MSRADWEAAKRQATLEALARRRRARRSIDDRCLPELYSEVAEDAEIEKDDIKGWYPDDAMGHVLP